MRTTSSFRTCTATTFLVLITGTELALGCTPPSLSTIVDKTHSFVNGLSLANTQAERDAICASVMTANHAALDPADPNTKFECIAPVVLKCISPDASDACSSALESIVDDLSDACNTFDEWGCHPGICTFAEGGSSYSEESVRNKHHALVRSVPLAAAAVDDATCPPLTMDDLVTKADALVSKLEEVERESKPIKKAVLKQAICKRFNPSAPVDPTDPTDLGTMKCVAPVVAACLGDDADPSCAAQLAQLSSDLSSTCGILDSWQCPPAFCAQVEQLRAMGIGALGSATQPAHLQPRRRRLAVVTTAATTDRRYAAFSFLGLGAGALLVVAVAGLLTVRQRPRAAPVFRDFGSIVVVKGDALA